MVTASLYQLLGLEVEEAHETFLVLRSSTSVAIVLRGSLVSKVGELVVLLVLVVGLGASDTDFVGHACVLDGLAGSTSALHATLVTDGGLELKHDVAHVLEEEVLGRVDLEESLNNLAVLREEVSLACGQSQRDVQRVGLAGCLGAQPVPDLEVLVLRLVRELHLEQQWGLAFPLLPATGARACFVLLWIRPCLAGLNGRGLLLLSCLPCWSLLYFSWRGCNRLSSLGPLVLLVALALVVARSRLNVWKL